MMKRLRPNMFLMTVAALGLLASSAFAGADDPQHKPADKKMGKMDKMDKMGKMNKMGKMDKMGGHGHTMAAMHGGQVTMTKEFHAEVAFHRQSVKLYLYDSSQAPIAAKGVSGTVTINFRDSKRKPLKAELSTAIEHRDVQGHDGKHKYGHRFLQFDLDLSKVKNGDAKAVFVLKNLPGDKEKEITFKETFTLARAVSYACPMNDIEPTSSPGDCPKCGMTLVKTESIYACPMHPNVTSRDADDKCWVCGMQMKAAGAEDDKAKKSDGHGRGH